MHCYGVDIDASALDRQVGLADPRHPHCGDRYVSAERLGSCYVGVQGNYRILIEHWNGGNWTRARRIGHPPVGSILTGVAATSGRNAWAVGYVAGFGTSLNPEAVL